MVGGSAGALQLEPSLLAAGVVGKAAGVGFVDAVQELAVRLQKDNNKKINTLSGSHKCRLEVRSEEERRGGAPPGSGPAAWLGAGFWKELGSRPAAAVVVGLRLGGQGYSPVGFPARRS